MRGLFVLGRAIFGGYFAYNGINHFLNRDAMTQYAASKGVASPESLVPATGALLLGGGLSIAAGLKPRQGIAAVIAFLIPVTLQMHRYWEESDPARQMTEMVNFTKNLALVGAALALLQI